VRRLATPEPDQQPNLVPFLDEPARIAGPHVEVVIVRPRPQPKLLQLRRVLVFLCLPLLLGLLVLEAAIVEQLADRRHGVCRHLHEIQVTLARHLQRLGSGDHAELLPIFIDKADLRNANRAFIRGPAGARGGMLRPWMFDLLLK
jgi:hypothetical protein